MLETQTHKPAFLRKLDCAEITERCLAVKRTLHYKSLTLTFKLEKPQKNQLNYTISHRITLFYLNSKQVLVCKN